MSALRILHVVPYYEHAWAYGGIPRVATAMTRGLARRGHDVTVYTTDACDETSRTAAAAPARTSGAGTLDVRVFRNISNRLAYHWQIFTPTGLMGHLRASAASFDLAHLHACHNLLVTIAARAFARAGVPYVLSPNGTAPAIERRVLAKELFTRIAGRHVLPGAKRVLAVSDAERRQLLSLGVADSRIVMVPNPIDEREFDPPPDGAVFRRNHNLGDAPVVLFLGKLTPRKGADILIRAFTQLGRSDAQLVIAGNDMRSGALEQLSRDRVCRVGLLRGRERLEALAAADVIAYPSRDEVFGLVPIEGLLCGSPVIVCNDSGCGEIIGTIGGGHIVPYGDSETLAGAIESILNASTLWRQRATSAATRARIRFGSDVVSELLEKVYRAVIDGGRREHRRSA